MVVLLALGCTWHLRALRGKKEHGVIEHGVEGNLVFDLALKGLVSSLKAGDGDADQVWAALMVQLPSWTRR